MRAYAATQGAGYALMLFNLDKDNASQVSVSLANTNRSSFVGSVATYSKGLYDESDAGIWAGADGGSLGTVGTTLDLQLPPWSQTVLLLQ